MNSGTLPRRHEQCSGIAIAQLIPSGRDQTAACRQVCLGAKRALFNVPVGTHASLIRWKHLGFHSGLSLDAAAAGTGIPMRV